MNGSNEQSLMRAIKPKNKKAHYTRPVLLVLGELKHCTLGSGGMGNDAHINMTKMSDVRIKEDICRVGEHSLGFGLYVYNHKPQFQEQCGYGLQFGVLAQEVERVLPSAVVTLDDGYKAVNYAMLGISFPK